MEIILQQLMKLLIVLKVKPLSGYGKTEIEWKDGTIVLLTKTESYKPGSIN